MVLLVPTKSTSRVPDGLRWQCPNALVEIFLTVYRKTRQRQQYLVGQTGPEAHPVGGLQPGLKVDTGNGLAHLLASQLLQLGGQQRFQAFGTGGEIAVFGGIKTHGIGPQWLLAAQALRRAGPVIRSNSMTGQKIYTMANELCLIAIVHEDRQFKK